MTTFGRTLTGLAVMVLLIVMTSCNEETQPVSSGDAAPTKTMFIEVDKGVIQEVTVPQSMEKSTAATVYPGLSCLKIAYDMSHDNGRQGMGRPTSPTGIYTTLFGDYVARGATITEIFTFNLATLQMYDVLWLEEDWFAVLTAAEMADLQAFVMAGGGVLISGDEWTNPEPFSAFGFGYTGGSSSGTTSNIGTHVVTTGVNTITLAGSQNGLTIPLAARPLVNETTGAYPYVAIMKYGMGKIAVVTDELFINLVIGSTDNRVLGNNLMTWLNIVHVPIDIHPGGFPNSINCKNPNVGIPVAILSNPNFDATMIDHTTVVFEGATETHVNKKTNVPVRHEEDVNYDGRMDLVFHFRYGDTNLDCNSIKGYLYGMYYCGRPVHGWDSVNMVP